MSPDLEKLRRFALIVALVHIAFASSGIELESGGTLNPLGIPLIITTPRLFGVVLIGTSFYALLRFLFYGYLTIEGPVSARKQVRTFLGDARKDDDGFFYLVVRSPNEAELWINRISKSVPGGYATTHEAGKLPHEPRDATPSAVVRAWIPNRAWSLAWLQDLDYAMPVWINVIAIIIGLWRVVSGT